MSKFSIILPVRNGGEYVKGCITSILSQSFTDFSLLVLDNCSTDGTLEWVQSIPDQRIKIFPAERSLSIEENWGRITTIPKDEFITLIGHDDLLNADYLQVMNELILKFPDASLYQTHFAYINGSGKKTRDCKLMPEMLDAESFLDSFLQRNIDVMGTGFMMRSKDYDVLGGIPIYPNLLFADFELWINLAKISYMVTSPLLCFSFRIHQSTTTSSPDTKFQQAFGQFIGFLNLLKNERTSFQKIIHQRAGAFLLYYCQGLSHRLLRTPKSKRNGLSVKKFIDQCGEYAMLLGVSSTFYPERVSTIRLAKLLDNNILGRSAFLIFKKIYSRPVSK